MKGLIIIILIITMVIPITLGSEICVEETTGGSNCSIITPASLSCSTVDVFLEDNLILDDFELTILNAPAEIKNFTFNFTEQGAYTIVLCDNTTAFLNIPSKTLAQQIQDVNFTINVSLGETENLIRDINRSITGRGDEAWTTGQFWQPAIMLLIIGVASFFAYNYQRMNKENNPIRLLFLFGSLFVLIIGANVGIQVIPATASAAVTTSVTQVYRLMILVTGFSLFYVLLVFGKDIIERFGGSHKRGKQGNDNEEDE